MVNQKSAFDTLPISVIITLQDSRRDFFCSRTLPSVVDNSPTEIIIEAGPGGMSEKRNRGARKATQPLLFFCDDDLCLLPRSLLLLYTSLMACEDDVGYSYGHYRIRERGGKHPLGDNVIVQGHPFDFDKLRRGNYINSCSLIKSEVFPGWDEQLRSYVDWDIWLTLAERGCYGCFVDEVLLESYYIDEGLVRDCGAESRAYISQKHSLGGMS